MALLDGWALAADDTLGAGGYAPALLALAPQRVEAGQPMPPDTDSVAPFDAVKIAGGRAEALVTVNPGDGVLAAGGDCDPAIPLRRAGERLRATDVAAFAAAGIARVTVREPRIRVLPLRGSGIINAAARLVASDIERRGGVGAAGRRRPRSRRRAGGGERGRHRRHRRHRQRPQRHQRADAGARGPASRCTASRSRRAKPPRSALSARGRCCCCRAGSTRRSPAG